MTAVAEHEVSTETEFQMVALPDLFESPLNPRKYFDKDALAELAESIKEHGVITPLLARPAGLRYELAAGHRRYRAARLAGIDHVPVMIRQMTDTQLLEVLTIENLQRQDVSALEEAQGFQALIDQAGYDAKRIAGRVGKSVEYVYARLKLIALTASAKKALAQGEMTPGHAILLARLEPEDQSNMLVEMANARKWNENGMSVRQLDALVGERIRAREAQKRATAVIEKLSAGGEKPIRLSDHYTTTVQGVKGRDEWQPAKKGDDGAVPGVLVQAYDVKEVGDVKYVRLQKAPTARNHDTDRYKKEEAQRNRAARIRSASRRAIWQAVIPKATAEIVGNGGALQEAEQLFVAQQMFRRLWNEHQKALCQLNGWKLEKGNQGSESVGVKNIAELDADAVSAFMLQCALIPYLDGGANSYFGGGGKDQLVAYANRLRLNPKAIEQRVRDSLSIKVQTSAKAKKRAGDVARARKAKTKRAAAGGSK